MLETNCKMQQTHFKAGDSLSPAGCSNLWLLQTMVCEEELSRAAYKIYSIITKLNVNYFYYNAKKQEGKNPQGTYEATLP